MMAEKIVASTMQESTKLTSGKNDTPLDKETFDKAVLKIMDILGYKKGE